MSFRKRGFQELVDDILTELTGGIVNEPIRFVVPNGDQPTFPLENTPVNRIASITGTVGGEFHQFSNTDFELTANRAAVRWLNNVLPDANSLFFVDYYSTSAQSPITDRNVGSVARTLVEAIGRELATLYEQLDLVYKAGFIDLAEGTSLDFVVALLGIERIRAGREVGEVVFGRSTPAPGDITIPQGTILATVPQGDAQQVLEFETTATRTMRQGQTEVTAPIRFLPTPEQQAAFTSGQVPAGAIRVIPKPIVGIETVTNPEPTARGAEDESDDQLRQRAKKALAQAGKSTVDALRAAVLSHGPGVSVVVQDTPRGVPGEVSLVIDGARDDAHRNDIFQSVLATKAAGILIQTNHSERIKMTLKLRLTTREDVQLSSEETRRMEAAIKTAIASYINGLKAGEDISRNTLVALSLADARLRNVLVEGLTLRRTGLTVDEALASRLRNANGQPTDLAGFDHVLIGQMEKAETTENDITVSVETGAAEVTTAVRITVTLAGNLTAIGVEKGVDANTIRPQIETLVRGFVESPERGGVISLATTTVAGQVHVGLIDFIEGGSGLFTLKPYSTTNPETGSFFVAEHVATGQVEREVDVVTLGEKERAELASLILLLQ